MLAVTADLSRIQWDQRGLAPVIVQDHESKQVLMLAWTNANTLQLTIETGQAHYWSRSRQEVWRKGATSGNTQQVMQIVLDCDEDALLWQVVQQGAACHRGTKSCFDELIR